MVVDYSSEGSEDAPTISEKVWAPQIRDSISDFVAQLSESSRQLASAAESFATASLGALDEGISASKAEQNSRFETLDRQISELDARLSAETARIADRIGEESRSLLQAFTAEVDARFSKLAMQLEQANLASSDLSARLNRAESMIGSLDARLAEFAFPVSEARGFNSSAQSLLARLEGDYELLTRVVEELQNRIGLGVEDNAVGTEPVSYAPPLPEPSHAAPSPVSEPAPYWTEQQDSPPETEESEANAITYISAVRHQAPVAEPSQPWSPGPVKTQPDTPAEPDATVSGRVTLQVGQVTDFDSLLTIDSALSRLTDVRNVSLANYSREEAVFRIDVAQVVSAQDLVQRLEVSSGRRLEIVAAESSTITLRLAA